MRSFWTQSERVQAPGAGVERLGESSAVAVTHQLPAVVLESTLAALPAGSRLPRHRIRLTFLLLSIIGTW